MLGKFILLVIFIFAFLRTGFGEGKKDNTTFYLFSSLIQSLIIYPVLFGRYELIETTRKMDFVAPYENSVGFFYPTFVSLIILLVSKTKKRFNWTTVMFPLVFLLFAFAYSYFTKYNPSYRATTVCLLVFLQIFIVIYVSRVCLSIDKLLYAVYDGFCIILIIELVVCLPYVFGGFDFLQKLFFAAADDNSVSLRVGTQFKIATGTTIQHNRLGGLAALIYVFYLSCLSFNYKIRFTKYLLAMSVVLLVVSQSRSAIIAAVLASIFSLFIVKFKKNEFSLAQLIMYFISGSLLLYVFFNIPIIYDMFFNSNVNEMEDARLGHFEFGMLALIHNDYWGTGMNSNTHFFYYDLIATGYGWFFSHSVHSIHWVLLVELGLLGFVVWVYYILSRLIRLITVPLSKMNNPIIWFSYGGMLIVAVVHGTADIVEMHYQYLLIIMLFGSWYTKKSPRLFNLFKFRKFLTCQF